MLESVKEILTREIDTTDLKAVMTKEIDLKKILQMELEIDKLKELLTTEIKLKEFLLTEVNIKDLLPIEELKDEDNEKELDKNNTIALSEAEDDTDKETAPEAKDSSDNSEQPQTATVPKLLLRPYKYGLIEQLKDDHKEIEFVYKLLMFAGKKRDFHLITVRLAEFSTLMRKHYQVADIDLYIYLKRYIQITYPKRAKAFNELNLEMKNISIEIFYSLIQSPNVPVCNKNYHAFMSEFDALGDHLTNRIEREKRVLFPMYEESHQATEISQLK